MLWKNVRHETHSFLSPPEEVYLLFIFSFCYLVCVHVNVRVCAFALLFCRTQLKKPTLFLSKAFTLQVTHQGHLALERGRKPSLPPATCLKDAVVIRYRGCCPQVSLGQATMQIVGHLFPTSFPIQPRHTCQFSKESRAGLFLVVNSPPAHTSLYHMYPYTCVCREIQKDETHTEYIWIYCSRQQVLLEYQNLIH